VGGRFHALSNRCPHSGGPLGQGLVEGAEVSCPLHNWTFHVTTGENTTSADMKVPYDEVRIEDGRVLVRLAVPE
jgi:nitrite reductase (NADH) small subunit